MTNITRFDPFQQIARFEPFRELEGFATWPRSLRRLFEEMPTEPGIKIDVTEDDKAYKVKADLPGVKKEDIVVEVEGNMVSITAEVKREKEEKKDEKVVHTERYFGSQFRSFTLGQEIDRNKVEAKFADGVLELTLPKAGGTTPQRIAIS
jgi:HSP20 family protein